MSQVNLADVADKPPMINEDNAVLRCMGCEQAKSKAGNDMLVFEWELCSPETVPDDKGKPAKVAGTKVQDWIVLGDIGLRKLKALHKALKLDMNVDLKAMNTKLYLGKAISAKVETDPQPLKDKQTGAVVLDDETGEPVIMRNYRLARIKSENLQFAIAADNVAF